MLAPHDFCQRHDICPDGATNGPSSSEARLDVKATDTDKAQNRLLAALSARSFSALAPDMERVQLDAPYLIAHEGEPFTHAYFPENAIISLVNRMSDGAGVEVGTIGNEGMAGLAAYLDANAAESETFCQVPGQAIRVPVDVLTKVASKRAEIRTLLNRYAHAYLTQVAQSAACNRLHGIERRCARWLLMTHDRVGRVDAFQLKQQFLAEMLGVRRAGVTVAAGALQEAGLIRYRRGVIRVLDRAGLEAASCECYTIVRRNFDRLV
jgi:CRP-like cAMP-binding protein